MRNSLYWDDFSRRINETVEAIKNKTIPPVRRVAVFITNQCNFRCDYCNMCLNNKQLSKKKFEEVIKKHGNTAIIHITGGEPSLVKWLYLYIEENKDVRFHLNTNAFIKPPKNIKRLKVSLDSHNEEYFNKLVHHKNAFQKVIQNIKEACEYTTVSITCVLSKENYKDTPEFMKFCRTEFPKLYAVFFSIYKGNNKRFKFSQEDINIFFNEIRPKLEKEMDEESRALFNETINEKFRLIQGVRFPENSLNNPCYISMSERVIDWNGEEGFCFHLFRDKIQMKCGKKYVECKYGCNRRLIMFNEEVERRLQCIK